METFRLLDLDPNQRSFVKPYHGSDTREPLSVRVGAPILPK
jgi:hypothetical protein